MADDNVVKLVTTSDGKLIKADELPKPGDPEWSRAVLRNVFNSIELPVDQRELILSGMSDERLNSLPLLLIGDILEMLSTPMEEYCSTYLERFPDYDISDEEESGLERFMTAIVADLCIYLSRSDSFITEMFERLTRGQLYSFYIVFVHSAMSVVQGKKIDPKETVPET